MKSAKSVFEKYLKTRGMLRSRQRDQILDVFLAVETHPTIDDLYARVKREYPTIGLATVYRAMKVICEAGLATETDFGDGVKRFEHKYHHEHHDHLVCVSCGQVIEVVSVEIECLQDKLAREHGFSPVRHEMKIYGMCARCRNGEE